jgi:hypothetical protein
MKKLIFFLFVLLGLQGFSQQHYSYRMPYASVQMINVGATSFETQEFYYSNGCIADDIEFWFGTDNPPTQNGYGRDPLTAPSIVFSNSYSCAQNTTYYYYVKITNCYGTYSYPVQSFTSLSTGATPTVTTTTATNITTTSASSGGNVTSDGGATVTARGVYYGVHNPPTSGTSDGSGVGSYTSSLTGMVPSTEHYYRAYATNSYGTGLGEIKTLTTLTPDGDPSVTTTIASGTTTTATTTGGNVQYDGGASITERGVCYSTSANPTILSSKVSSGTGLGTYTVALSSLTPNTTYYYRAYAKNATDEIGYGGEFSFTTLSASSAPTVVTNTATNILAHGSTLNGNVTNQGSSAVTGRGFVYSLTDNTPQLGESGVTNLPNSTGGTGVYSNSFFSQLIIPCGTVVYFNTYAINSEGTAYGTASSFTTSTLTFDGVNRQFVIQTQSPVALTVNSESTAIQVCDSLYHWHITNENYIRSGFNHRVVSFSTSNYVYSITNCLVQNQNGWRAVETSQSPRQYWVAFISSGVITTLYRKY